MYIPNFYHSIPTIKDSSLFSYSLHSKLPYECPKQMIKGTCEKIIYLDGTKKISTSSCLNYITTITIAINFVFNEILSIKETEQWLLINNLKKVWKMKNITNCVDVPYDDKQIRVSTSNIALFIYKIDFFINVWNWYCDKIGLSLSNAISFINWLNKNMEKYEVWSF